jgi:predicted Fe-Mo cluster-binding NifX family protein
MKIAIPEWQGRISPVLDVSRNLKVFEIDEDHIRNEQDIVCSGKNISDRVMQLKATGVEVLICGAVSQSLLNAILRTDIEVIPQTCGYVSDVVSAFSRGLLTKETFLMPGCRRRRRGCRGRGHQSKQHNTRRQRCQEEMEQDQWVQEQ